MRSSPLVPEAAQTLLFLHPSPWPEQPCGRLAAAAQFPAPSPRLPRLAASRPRCTTPRLSSSVYSFQIHSCCFLFGSLFCVMLFQLFFQSLPPPPPLPFPVAEFLRREDFEETVSTSALWLQHFRRALSGAQVPGSRTRWAVEAGGQGAGPWQLRPVVGTLTAAGRAEPQGSWVLPKSWSHSSPTPWPCWLWLLALGSDVCMPGLG